MMFRRRFLRSCCSAIGRLGGSIACLGDALLTQRHASASSFNRSDKVTEMHRVRWFSLVLLTLALSASHPAAAQVPDARTAGSIPTLAPLVRQVTPAVINISVLGRVREDNPLYRDPIFREFFDTPKQIVAAIGQSVCIELGDLPLSLSVEARRSDRRSNGRFIRRDAAGEQAIRPARARSIHG